MAWEYDGKPFSGVGTRPWLGPKFWCPGMQNTADFSNQKVFRYADAILMMADCSRPRTRRIRLPDAGRAVRYTSSRTKTDGPGHLCHETTAYVFKNSERKDALLNMVGRLEHRSSRTKEVATHLLTGEFQRNSTWYAGESGIR